MLYPTLLEPVSWSSFISASILSAKAKQFDDGLYAAVEIAAEKGAGDFKGKELLLKSIYESLNEAETSDNATRSFIEAACELGGIELKGGSDSEIKEQIKNDFLSNELRSKPIGFYTWNSEVSKIFQQDRLLQTPLKKPFAVTGPVPLANAIENSGNKNIYIQYMELIEKLTNPFPRGIYDLRTLIIPGNPYNPEETFAMFPPSRAYETDLIKKLYGNAPIPDGFNLADKLIEEIKAGRIDLTPEENSGWYDYQTYSLEPLVMPEKFPESKKVEFSENYKKELLELFKSLLALTRETHIKQLEIPVAGGAAPPEIPTIYIYPDLSVEPLATYYLRRAESYDFIHNVLIDTFGKEGLKSMHRLTKEGPVELSLDEELEKMKSLFYGSYFLVCAEIGSIPDTNSRDIKEDREFASEWMEKIGQDEDLLKDSRMMVPVFYDLERKMTKVWVFLGYETKSVSIEFKKFPEVSVYNSEGKKLAPDEVELEFDSTKETLVYPVFAEIYVKKILSREEFQEICNQYKTRSKILEALQE